MGLSGSTGLGKLNYAKYWMYNTHLALRWNKDPKTMPGINPYQASPLVGVATVPISNLLIV